MPFKSSHSPQIGRPVQGGRRELLIGGAARGDVALCHCIEAVDTVAVLAVRSQRGAGFKRQVFEPHWAPALVEHAPAAPAAPGESPAAMPCTTFRDALCRTRSVHQ